MKMYTRCFENKFIFLLTVLLFMVSFSACSSNKGSRETSSQETKIYDDISFVQSKFPEVKGIKSVKFVYCEIGSGGIGLQPKEFKGIIQIDEDIAQDIYTKYKWKEQQIQLPSFMESGKSSTVLYSDKFDEDMHTSSFAGKIYFNKANNCIYFLGEY